MDPLDDETLQQLYTWVDEIPLTRPKRNINRDFSDGVMLAEVVHHFIPRLVELHNYSAAHSVRQKMYNWQTLNQKALKRLGCQLSPETIDALVNAKPGVIENVLVVLQQKIAEFKERPKETGAKPAEGEVYEDSPPPRESYTRQSGVTAPPEPSRAPTGSSAPSARGSGSSAPPAPAPAPVSARSVPGGDMMQRVDADILLEKEQTIQEFKETVQILELKIRKLEQLVRIKDSRIQTLTARVQALEGGAAGGPQ